MMSLHTSIFIFAGAENSIDIALNVLVLRVVGIDLFIYPNHMRPLTIPRDN